MVDCRVAVVAVSLLALAGCSRGDARDGGPPDPSSPGGIAVAYVNAVTDGDYARAVTFVSPPERNVLEAITAGNPPSGDARNIAVGSESISGDSAIVVLTGTICTAAVATGPGSTGSGGVPSSSPPTEASADSTDPPSRDNVRCFTNTDPRSMDPVFRVSLTRDATADRWFITFDLAGMLPSGS